MIYSEQSYSYYNLILNRKDVFKRIFKLSNVKYVLGVDQNINNAVRKL